MEALLELRVNVPISHIAALLVLSTIILMWGKYRLALIINYLFLFFWLYILIDNVEFIRGIDGIDMKNAALYYGFGFVIIILTLLGLSKSHE